MTFPADLDTITVRHTITDAGGRPLGGNMVRAVPEHRVWVSDGTTGGSIVEHAVEAPIAADGTWELDLPYVDQEKIRNKGVAWKITEDVPGRPKAYRVAPVLAHGAGPIDVAEALVTGTTSQGVTIQAGPVTDETAASLLDLPGGQFRASLSSTIGAEVDRVAVPVLADHIAQVDVVADAAATRAGVIATDPLVATAASTVGSSTRTAVREAASATVDIAEFGAVGDGSTDDTDAIKAALTAAQPGTRLTGTGTYRLTSSITVAHPFVILDGLNLRFTGKTNGSTITAAVLLTDRGAAVEGGSIHVIGGDYRRVIDLAEHDTRVEHCEVRYTSPDHGGNTVFPIFSASGGTKTGVIINDNDVSATTPHGDGIQASSRPGIRVTNNRVHDGTALGSQTHQNWAIYVSQGSPGAVIAHNTITNWPVGGIQAGGTTNYTIHDNTVTDVRYIGISVGGTHGTALRNTVSQAEQGMSVTGSDADVRHNDVHTMRPVTSPLDGTRPMISLVGNRNTVEDNVIGARGDALAAIVVAPTATGNKIVRNIFDTNRPSQGIIANGSPDLTVSGNTFRSTDDPTIGSTIRATGPDPAITRNTITGTTGGTGINVSAAPRPTIEQNTITGGRFALGGLNSATDGTVQLNKISGLTGDVIPGTPHATNRIRWNDGAPLPAVSGSRGGNAALASVLTQLAAQGLIADTTTA